MRFEKAVTVVKIGPGGRHCPCCAPPPRILKRLEHRAARRRIAKLLRDTLADRDR